MTAELMQRLQEIAPNGKELEVLIRTVEKIENGVGKQGGKDNGKTHCL